MQPRQLPPQGFPYPHKPTITAFTPHLDGNFGVTIAEYAAELGND